MDTGRIGILTGGGDCPGLNAVIRGVVRRALADDVHVVGFKSGWQGLITGDVEPLTRLSVAGIQFRGGTILGTSRTDPFADPHSQIQIRENWRKYGIRALVVVGGNGTLTVASRMALEEGYPVVGVPKTIDNDIPGTDYSFGFSTAVQVATDAIERLHTTAESHHRVMVIEVMGRHTGWIAAHAGIAGAADFILVPEVPFRISRITETLANRRGLGRPHSIVVVAEDARPHRDEDFLSDDQKASIYREERLGGIGQLVAREIERRSGIEARVSVLGYIQRGGSPNAFDRVLATRFGVKAVEMVLEGRFGRMAALSGTSVIDVALADAVEGYKYLDPEFYRHAEIFFG
ncbi:MAG: 6-phosphofructokinase [Acidobacteria bacterium]|nr:6-phosphofructokinase [Acidobacteriota bacterium]